MADAKVNLKGLLFDPIVKNNPIALQILGICSALAVTTQLQTAIVMAIAVSLVTGFSSLFISKICGAELLTSRSLNPVFLHSLRSVRPWRCVLVPVT